MRWILQLSIMAWLFCAGVVGQDSPVPSEKTAVAPNDPIEVLSDTRGVDFKPYTDGVLKAIKQNWFKLIPQEAEPPLNKKGRVSIEFAVLRNGKIENMKLVASSGVIRMDHAAWSGIKASEPLPPLPDAFAGPRVVLRCTFWYNPDKSDLPANKDAPLEPIPK